MEFGLPGDIPKSRLGAIPTPDSATVVGLPTALLAIVKVPVRVPVVVGVKATWISHEPAGDTELPQLFDWLKFPEMEIPEIFKAGPLVFIRVIDCAALMVPVGLDENVKDAALRLIVGGGLGPKRATL